jgi:flavin reductase
MTVSRQEFRDAMARLGSAVNVVTTAGSEGEAAFTASAVCSVTDDPPTLLVCLRRGSSVWPIVTGNGVLCLNVLAHPQQAVAELFASSSGPAMRERFAHHPWSRLVTGAPVLDGAIVSFDCRIADVFEKGTHSVLFGEVQAIRQGNPADSALLYFSRSYHALASIVSTKQ